MSESPVRIGIIGAGSFSAQHLAAYRELEGAEVVALCRRDPQALAAMQEEWGVAAGFTSHSELLADDRVDAVSIVTPTDSHKQIVFDAARAGKHVLCEKPLALTAADCREMLAAVESAGVVHCVNFNQRGRTQVGRMRWYMDRGYTGPVYHVNIWWGMSLQEDVRPVGSWRFRPESGGGTIYELIHVLDMARLLGGEVARICCTAPTAEPFRTFSDVPEGMAVTVPDSSAFLVEFAAGGYGVLHTSFVSRGWDYAENAARVEVSGRQGRLVTAGRHELRGMKDGDGPTVVLDEAPAYPSPYRQFVEAVRTGRPVTTDFATGVAAAVLVDAAMESAHEGRWVDVPSAGR